MQLQIDYCSQRRENNKESQAILDGNKDSINNQCSMVKALLESGYRLTVRSAIVEHNISSLPRRVLDLKQKGVEVKSRLINKKFKEYYI